MKQDRPDIYIYKLRPIHRYSITDAFHHSDWLFKKGKIWCITYSLSILVIQFGINGIGNFTRKQVNFIYLLTIYKIFEI